MHKKGVLLINLGTPDSPSTTHVRRYLNEFLMDGRVIDIHPILRALLVKGIIVPFRGPKSARLYQKIWSEATGSPLKHHSLMQAEALQQRLGDHYHVVMAMRYQNPSIEEALQKLRDSQVYHIQILPLFPQYASASTGSVFEEVMRLITQWHTIPNLSWINSFHDHALMIETFAENARKYPLDTYDHVLFSFHGLPESQLKNADYTQQCCLKKQDCCHTRTSDNECCYAAQCHHTAQLIAKKLDFSIEKYTICFQSRLGKDPWIQPYMSDIIKTLAKRGVKRLLVFCPTFVADCLETLYEVTVEYGNEFKALGGEHLQLVESLNNHPLWIKALEQLVKERANVM